MHPSAVESALGYSTQRDTPTTGLAGRSSSSPSPVEADNNDENENHNFLDKDQADAPPTDRAATDGIIELSRLHTTSVSLPLSGMPNLSPETTIPTNDKTFMPATTASEAPFDASTWLEKALAKYEKVVKLQDRFLTDQSRLKTERDTVNATFHRLKDSIDQYVQLWASGESATDNIPGAESREAAYEQLIADEKAFDDQMQLVIKREQSLGKLQYRLGGLLPGLLDDIGSCFPGDLRARHEASDSHSVQSHPPSSPELHPLEDEYYSKRGDVRQLRDRLFSHLAEIQQSIDDYTPNVFTSADAHAPTLVAGDSGFPSQQSASRDRWKTEHEEMLRQLHIEEQELKRLWDACQVADIDVGELSVELPETRRAAAQSPSLEAERDVVALDAPPFLRLSSDGIVSRFLKGLRWPERGGFVPPLLLDLPDLTGKRDFIENWVGKITDTIFGSAPEPSAHTEFPHTVTPFRYESDWQVVRRVPEEVTAMKDYVVIHAGHTTTPSEDGPRRSVSRRVLRRWKSNDALTDSTRMLDLSKPEEISETALTGAGPDL